MLVSHLLLLLRQTTHHASFPFRVHHGRTRNAGNCWNEAEAGWGQIEASYEKFLRRVYRK